MISDGQGPGAELKRINYLWVESPTGERTKVTGRFTFEYRSPDGVYVMESEPEPENRPLYARTLRREGSDEPLSPEEHQRVLHRILVMLQFSGDTFQLIQ